MEDENVKAAWDMYIVAVSEIVEKYGLIPTPVYKEPFREATLTKFADIEMLVAGEKEKEVAQKVLHPVVDNEPKTE